MSHPLKALQIFDPKTRWYVVLAIGLIGLAGCGSNPKTYIDRGNKFYDAGKYDDAGLQYQRAIQKDANSTDAYYRLSLVELKRGQVAEAYKDLQRAVEISPDNLPAVFREGQLALRSYTADPKHPERLFQQAKTNARNLLGKQPLGYEGNLLQAALNLEDKKPADAITHLRTALQAKPKDPDAMLGLARALVDDNQTDAGLKEALELINTDKTFGPVYDFLFQHYARLNDLASADSVLKLKVSNNPKQAAFILELARFYAATKRPADVTTTLKLLTDNPKDFPNGHVLAGDFYSSAGAPDLAMPQYEAGLQTASKDKNVYRKRIAVLLAGQRKYPEVYKQIQDCLKDDPKDQEAKLMRAVAWMDEGKPENLDPAMAELTAQLKTRPQNPGAHFELGNGLMRKGDQEGARREWVAAARQGRTYLPPRYALAQLDLAKNDARDALRVAEDIVSIAPRDEQALVLRATTEIAAGQYQRAHSDLDRLALLYPKSARVGITIGVLALAEKRYPDAERIFTKLAAAGVQSTEVLSGLTQAYLSEKQPEKALQNLQDVLKRNPNSLTPRELLARAALSTGKYDIAIEQYKQLAAAIPGSIQVQRELAAAYNAQGNAAAAISTLRPAVQKNPSDTALSLDLAHTLLKTGRIDEAKTEYRRMLKIQPNDANALNDLSYLMSQSGESLDEALTLARKGAQIATDQNLKNSLQDTLGSIYLKKNMYDSALQSFQVAVNSNPASMTFRYHLGTTLYQMGNKPRAKEELQAALAAKAKSEDEPKIKELLSKL
jgi:tetratricopeptide (TPR) repeat protein